MKYKMEAYEDFKIWQKGLELEKAIFQTTDSFITEDAYVVAIQIKKSILSIISNLAEGFMRRIRRDNKKENKQSFQAALILLEWLEKEIILCEQSGFLTPAQSKEILTSVNELNAIVTGLLELE
jgi:four helix bundle protein